MELRYVIETLLFAYGEPMSAEKIAKLAGAKPKETKEALEELSKEYSSRGLALMRKNGDWQLGTNPENAKYLETLFKSEFEEELSKAALETLAIVAYKGPLTRAQIEFIRGVNSSFTLRNLLMRGLVERAENPKDARAPIYKVTFRFLSHFGLSRIEDLPGFAELKDAQLGAIEEEFKKMSENQ